MEINKYISKNTIIHLCIIIIILIILRILYSTFYSSTEGFITSDSPATDLLSKLKSIDTQQFVNLTNSNLEMQIYSWSNKIYNMEKTEYQSKPIAFYKPNLIINQIQYYKLGDIVSQNADYSLPNVDQFTLLVKKNTSDVKPPIRFDLMTTITNSNFNNDYYDYSNYITNSININNITNSLVHCASAIKNLNNIIQSNLSTLKLKFVNQVYKDVNIKINGNSKSILSFLENIGEVVGEVVEGFDNTVNTDYIDFLPSPLITTPYTDSIPITNLSVSNGNNYTLPLQNFSSLNLPAGTVGYILFKENKLNFSIPSNIDLAQDLNKNNIIDKLSNVTFTNLNDSNIVFNNVEKNIFLFIPVVTIMNYVISLCNEINNIYNNQPQLLIYLNLAPNIDMVKSVLNIMNLNSNLVDTITIQTIIEKLNTENISTSNTSTLLELVLYIIKNMMINYNLTSLNITINNIINVKTVYDAFITVQKSFPVDQEPLINKPSYIGCYNDTVDEGRRLIENYLGKISNVDECAQKAQTKGYNYFGVQWGIECWANNDLDRAMRKGQANHDCGALGGYWVNQIYSVNRSPSMSIIITNVNNDIISYIPSNTYSILTNTSIQSIIIPINNILKRITKFSKFISEFSNNSIDYFPLQIYKPIAPDNYTSLGHVFCNTPTDLKKIIDSKNVACIPSHCVKEIRDWTVNDKIFENNKKNTYFAIYFNPYTGTFISTNNNAQQLPDGKVCKVVACVAKCTAIDDLQKADDCSRKYYNLNNQAVTSTPLTSTLVSSQEEEFYLDKIQNQSDSITRLRQRAQKMQTDTDKAIIVNREMNQNKLQDYVDLQKQNIDIIMKRLQADKNKIQTNVNIPADTLKSLIQMIKDSSLLNSEQKTNLLTKIASSQNLPNSQYNANLNEVLKSCPQFDLTGLVSKKTVSDVCYGCDIPK